jgi:hypothetical protein
VGGNRVMWIGVAVAVLALGVFELILGLNLLPSMEVAEQRGVVAPLFVTWTMVAVTVVTTAVLAVYLFAVATGRAQAPR